MSGLTSVNYPGHTKHIPIVEENFEPILPTSHNIHNEPIEYFLFFLLRVHAVHL